MKVWSLKAPKMAIDLGTANTLVLLDGKGIVVEEPSVVARTIHTGELVASGKEAFTAIGNAPNRVIAVRPLRDGVIADFEATVFLLKNVMKQAISFSIQRPDVLLCAPTSITNIEERALIEAAKQAGANHVFMIEEPYAAAIGADLPVLQPVGSMVIDIGGGTTDVATISLGHIIYTRSSRGGGDQLDTAIVTHVVKEHGIVISERTAEMLKRTIGVANHTQVKALKTSITVQGRDVRTGRQRVVTIQSDEIKEVFDAPIEELVLLIREVLEQSAPEILADIMEHGITLTGGGSLLPGLATVLANELRLPVHMSQEPLYAVIKGTGDSLKNMEEWKKNYLLSMR